MEMEKPSSLESLAIELMIELPALCYLPCSLRAALALYECECECAQWCVVRVRECSYGAEKNDKSAKHETNSPLPLHTLSQQRTTPNMNI